MKPAARSAKSKLFLTGCSNRFAILFPANYFVPSPSSSPLFFSPFSDHFAARKTPQTVPAMAFSSKVSAAWMRQRMDAAKPLLEGGGAHRGCAHHMGARDEILAVCKSLRQVLEHQPHTFDSDAVGHRMIARRAIGFETMGKRIHAGAGGD